MNPAPAAAQAVQATAQVPPPSAVTSQPDSITPVLILGGLTALNFIAALFFSVFRVPAGGWMKWHKRFAYAGVLLMTLHATLALYQHFFE